MNERFYLNLQIALTAILQNKIRSILTALGIIFGVAAVISMLAIGNGAKQEILEQIKLVGVNNIVITPLVEQEEEKVDESLSSAKTEQKKFSPGLNLKDAQSIKSILPCVEKVSPEIVLETTFIRNGLGRTGKLVGVEPAYFEITDFKIESGRMFNESQLLYGEQVCIIGKGVQSKFFSNEDPLGKYIKCGSVWLKVIGVTVERKVSKAASENLGIRDFNMDIYAPVKTVLIRYENRGVVTKASLQMGNEEEDEETPTTDAGGQSIHQIDRLVIKINNTNYLTNAAEVISRLMLRRHYGVTDYEITVPELLLKQQQRTKDIFNMVLGAIAGISLLVGGIGIMNIMLASVLERIKEIGLRLSVGATKKDIVQQFLIESVLISLTGGLAGVVLGILMSYLVSGIAKVPTIISFWSIVLSFGVSATVGLLFGITPAKRAAEQDPIKSLRYE